MAGGSRRNPEAELAAEGACELVAAPERKHVAPDAKSPWLTSCVMPLRDEVESGRSAARSRDSGRDR